MTITKGKIKKPASIGTIWVAKATLFNYPRSHYKDRRKPWNTAKSGLELIK